MTERLPPPYGKEAPVWFLEGYACAMMEAVGFGITQAIFTQAGNSWISDHKVRYQQTQILLDYLNPKVPHDPLDYQMVALLHEGLHYVFPTSDTSATLDMVTHTMHTTGLIWWLGEAPADIGKPWTSLLSNVGPLTRARLNAWRCKPFDAKDILDLLQRTSCLGVQFAIEEIAQCSGVDCYCIEQGDELHVIIPTYPLCLHATPPCEVFMGVVEGIITWLHSTHLRTAIRPRLQIDSERSTGHHIILAPMQERPAYDWWGP